MKKYLILALCLTALLSSCKNDSGMIKTHTPPRPKGQTDVLELRADPMPVVRIAFIGLGMRGHSMVHNMTHIEGVEIVAICDMEKDRVQRTNDMLERRGFPRALEFYGDPDAWRELTALPNVDLVYITTGWRTHAMMTIQAMKDGKHVAVEIPSAVTMEEIWDIINTAEQTRKHVMQLENCIYDFFELTALNMAQHGLFGEIIHAEGAYIHALQPFWNMYWNNWRLDFNRNHRGDTYPNHGLGPVALAMNINRGDRLNYLVSVDTRAIGSPEFIREKTGEIVTDFRNGDHTTTLISTKNRNTIVIQHNVTSPRPYDRKFQLTGTKGFANKYPIQGFALCSENLSAGMITDHENLDAHNFVPDHVRRQLMEKFKHPIVAEIEERARQVGGHGGMDFIMNYRLIYCLRHGLPLDMNVYDLATWSSLVPLTEISLDNGSRPVEIPDFTRGAWNRLNRVTFHMKED